MEASKENCQRALDQLEALKVSDNSVPKRFVKEFLQAMAGKLPSVPTEETKADRKQAVEDAARKGYRGE